jgi:signal transduction histidine kinase
MTARLGLVDTGFAVLRLLTITGGAGWILLGNISYTTKALLVVLLLFFLLYSIILYVLILFFRVHVRKFYLAALILDLCFVYLLVRETGGIASNFYLAFYLLAALHSFYYGLLMGIVVAAISCALYLTSGNLSTGTIQWTDLALRVSFLFIVSVSLGILSEKEKKDRKDIEKLNIALASEKVNLQNAYTDLERAQQQLMQSEKLASIGTLASGVAHEIRNPLDGIQNCIGSIIRDPDNKEQTERYLRLIQDGLDRMESTVRKLLDFARQSRLVTVTVNVDNVITGALELVEHNLRDKRMVVRRLKSNGEHLVRGDPQYLQQAFLNIILNAIDAMSEGGTLTVELSRVRWQPPGSRHDLGPGKVEPGSTFEGNFIGITFTDTGCGIPKENLNKIFDPFFSTKSVGKGTGLGLSVCLGIIREHKGYIEVESKVGEGSTFRVLLPHENYDRKDTISG